MIKHLRCIELDFLKPITYNNLTRLGSLLDGGYILPLNSVLDSTFLISGGISVNTDFENDVKSINNKIEVVLVDGSLNIFKYFILRPFYKLITKRTLYPFFESYKFFKIYVKATFLKKYISQKFGIDTMLDYTTSKNNDSTGILKLDIEGSEYEILQMILDHKKKFNTIVIEFHDVKNKISDLKYFVEKLNYKIVNVSVNEVGIDESDFPNLLEITFINDYIYHSKFLGQNRNNEKGNDLYILDFN
jgi:hypothetical protein